MAHQRTNKPKPNHAQLTVKLFFKSRSIHQATTAHLLTHTCHFCHQLKQKHVILSDSRPLLMLAALNNWRFLHIRGWKCTEQMKHVQCKRQYAANRHAKCCQHALYCGYPHPRINTQHNTQWRAGRQAACLSIQLHIITFISDMLDSSSFLRKASSVSSALTISLRYRSYSRPKFWKLNDVTWLHTRDRGGLTLNET